MNTVLLLGTFDTKGDEYAYVRSLIEARGHGVVTMNLGVLQAEQDIAFPIDVTAEDVARAGGASLAGLRAQRDRGTAVEAMLAGARVLTRELYVAEGFGGVLGLGGGG